MNLRFAVWKTFLSSHLSQVKAIFYFLVHSSSNIRQTFSLLVHLLCQN